jgi:hypothetical protein
LVADGNVFFKDIVNGNGKGFFGISFAAFSGFVKDANGVDYDTTSLKVYTIHIKARKSGKADAKKTLTVTIYNVFEKDIAIGNQARSVNENSVINTGIGDPLVTSGTIATFAITAGNGDGFFKINNTGQIQVAKVGLDFEGTHSYTLTVKITGSESHVTET